jgi:hypothetical protein
MKREQLGETIKIYCLVKIFLGKAIANSLFAGAPPMLNDKLKNAYTFLKSRIISSIFYEELDPILESE